MENKALLEDIKRCLRKRMNYRETREYLLMFDKYEQHAVISSLQKEYVKHKTKTSRTSMVAGFVMLTLFPLVHWLFEHNASDYEIGYKPMIFGVVIIASSFVSFQRAQATTRRYEEFA